MPLTLTSDRPTIVGLATRTLKRNPGLSLASAVRSALQNHYSLADEDGIYGGSDAALCLGYRGHSEDENLLDEIIEDLVSEATANETVITQH